MAIKLNHHPPSLLPEHPKLKQSDPEIQGH